MLVLNKRVLIGCIAMARSRSRNRGQAGEGNFGPGRGVGFLGKLSSTKLQSREKLPEGARELRKKEGEGTVRRAEVGGKESRLDILSRTRRSEGLHGTGTDSSVGMEWRERQKHKKKTKKKKTSQDCDVGR